jgi:signal transduction histidine kinase/CheY-like chemotaxis protein
VNSERGMKPAARRGVPGWVARASVGARVWAALSVVVVVLIGDLGVTAWGMHRLSAINDTIQSYDFPLRDDSETLLVDLINEETGLRGYLLTKDPSFLDPLHSGQAAYRDEIVAMRRLIAGQPSLGQSLEALNQRVETWRTEYEQPQLESAAIGRAGETAADATRGKALFDQIRAAQDELDTRADAIIAADFAAAASERTRIVTGLVIGSVMGVVLAIAVLLVTFRSILRPLRGLRVLARDLQEGRPATSRASAGPPELQEVSNAITTAASALQDREAALARANEDLERANQAKSVFLATMSHELRTPLNAILGFTDLVLDGGTGPIAETTKDYLERVSRNGRILLELINDVLDLSKIEAGRMPIVAHVVAVEPQVRQVVANVQALADEKGLLLEVVNATPDCTALADPRALAQILTNLVGNAVKYADTGVVRVAIRADPGAVTIDVIDNGPGIDPDDQPVIFQPFRRVGETARTGTGGTGLGLAISSRLAKLQGGDLTVDSTLGAGSRFTLTLPSAAVTGVLALRDPSPPLVLAVDDDADALGLWQAQVERMGCAFLGVQRPSTAVQAAADVQPAVILLDVLFPDGSGWDVLTRLRQDPRTASIPVHVVSNNNDEQVAQSREVEFLRKPVTDEQLKEALMPYLRRDQEVLA